MICLDDTDVIEGGASVDAVIDYQIHGLAGTTFTQLAAGVMGTTLTTVLYTAGAAISVVSIILVNKHTSVVNITLCLDPANGGNPRYIIPKTISLGAGYSLHTDGARITVMDASGNIVTSYGVHAASHTDGTDDIQNATAAQKGVATAAQITKLDAIEANADVTDSRSQFTYSDADQITCGAAQYMCKDKYCYWISTITTVATGAAGGADWWYLYLDYSAITSGVALTASELVWSTTEPTWNTTYCRWMNGDDRCIFAVRTDGSSNILEFLHEGDLITFADDITTTNEIDIDSVWTDLSALIIPKFSRQAVVTFYLKGDIAGSAGTAFWRTNGQTGTIGHKIGYVDVALPLSYIYNTQQVFTDSNGIIEFRYSADNAAQISVYCFSWILPIGI